LFGISRQAVYQSEKREQIRADELALIKPLILRVRRQMPRLGTRKLYYLLKVEFEKMGVKIGRDALFDYLRSESMLINQERITQGQQILGIG